MEMLFSAGELRISATARNRRRAAPQPGDAERRVVRRDDQAIREGRSRTFPAREGVVLQRGDHRLAQPRGGDPP
ncbi:hypothetical protein LO772_04755 [Yinghuangia sp. ASG 101]|uniref:hypothetical protein n=1 Tax=Yinghuangia sp. ASG 101 TaxID=2896848 RepID=UPI001E4DC15C|nr:hypothetical protein [Yinghuangia sp. ASG 101]UGQ12934.1 hypothetical protein LO772_04755 [Yinghuangia sp. ASG 101]